MERFLEAGDKVARPRGVINFLGLVDLTATVLMIFNYFLATGITTASAWAIVLNVLHSFTWAVALVIGAEIVSVPFVKFLFAIYGVSFLMDLGAFFIRLSAALGSGGLFLWFTFVLGAILLGLDMIQIIAGGTLTWAMKRYRQRMLKFVDTIMESNIRSSKLHKVPRRLYRNRIMLSFLWQAQLAMVILQLVVFSLGINLSLSYAALLLFDLPSLFSWVFARAVSGTLPIFPPDALTSIGVIFSVFALYVISLVLAFVALVWRLVILIQQTINPTIVPVILTNLRLGFGWFSFTLTTLLFIVILIETLVIYYVTQNLDEHYGNDPVRSWGPYLRARWMAKGGDRGIELDEQREADSERDASMNESKSQPPRRSRVVVGPPPPSASKTTKVESVVYKRPPRSDVELEAPPGTLSKDLPAESTTPPPLPPPTTSQGPTEENEIKSW